MTSDAVAVTVLGLGTMGHGMAQAFASKGMIVRGYDESPAARDSLTDRIRRNLTEFVRFELMSAEEATAALARITAHDSVEEACAESTFVVEAVREDLTIKQDLFARVEDCVAPETILASNSSSFCISDSGSRLRHPERAMVTHWFNPPHIIPTVEIVPSPHTTEQVIQTTLQLHRRIGKLSIVLRQELPGFLVNRVQVAVMREVWDLLERGVASAEDLDAAIRGSMGFRLAALGPLSIHDFGGLDVASVVYRVLCPEIRSDTVLPKIVQQLVSGGKFGFKTGAGFYSYPEHVAPHVLAERDENYLRLLKLFHASQTDISVENP